MIFSSTPARSLAGANPRESYCIRALDADEETRRRLIGMGFVPGARVEVMRCLGCGPLAVRVGDSRLAVDRALAERILITPAPSPGCSASCRVSGRRHRWGWRKRSKAV